MPRRLSEVAYNLHRISQLPVLRIKRAAQLPFNSLLHKLSQIVNIKHRTLVVPTREYRHFGSQLSQSREIPLRIRPINHRRAQNAHFETIAFQFMQPLFSLQLTVPIESIRIFFRISSQHLRFQRLALMKHNLTRHKDKLLHARSLRMLRHLNREVAIHLIV